MLQVNQTIMTKTDRPLMFSVSSYAVTKSSRAGDSDFYLGTHDEIIIMMKTTNQHDHTN